MIEIRNLQLPLSGGEASGVAYDPARLRETCARRLRCDPSELGACAVARRAVDARKRGDVHFVATVRVEAADGSSAAERSLVERAASNDVVAANPPAYEPPVAPGTPPSGARSSSGRVRPGCSAPSPSPRRASPPS